MILLNKTCKCLKCEHQDNYNKPEVIISRALCKNCGKHFKNRTGEIHKGLRIIKGLGGKRIACKCIHCGYEDDYDKSAVCRGNVRCNNCKPKYINIINKIFNDLKIIKDLGNRNVICQCIYCGIEDEYQKYSVLKGNVRCKYCSLIINCKDKVINNITVIDRAYTGRDGNDYFNCKCNKCGKELLLTREEIIKYTCHKEKKHG